MQLELPPKPSAAFPVPTVPAFATLMLLLPVAFTNRTVALLLVPVTVSESSPHAARNTAPARRHSLNERYCIGTTSVRREIGTACVDPVRRCDCATCDAAHSRSGRFSKSW